MTSPVAPTDPATLPNGASGWSHVYYADGKRRESRVSVPTNQYGEIVGKGWTCRDCGPSAKWFPATKTTSVPVCATHGKQMRPVVLRRPPILPFRELWGAIERPLRPVWALPGMAAIGFTVDASHVPTLAIVGLAPVAGVVAYRIARRGSDTDPELHEAVRRAARAVGWTATAATGWLALVDALTLAPHSPLAAGILWGSLLAVAAWPAATWWRRNRQTPEVVYVPPPVPRSYEPSRDERDAAEAASAWRTYVDIPGTELEPDTYRRIKGGWQAVIRATRRGALIGLGGDNMPSTVKRVAAGFNVPRAAIGWIDEFESSPNAALLLVQPDSPLREDVAWQPPGVLPIDEAYLHMGMRIDGSPLRTRLWTPGWGSPSRFIAGTKGSGKTESLRLLVLGMLEAQVASPRGPRRLVAPFLHDPKRGKDFGAFRRQVSGFSTDAEMLHLIVEAFIREMDRRYDALGSNVWFDEHGRPREGETAFDPSIHGPVLSLVVDEFHEPAKDQMLMAKFDPMSRKMRAAGIEIVAATHMSTISDTGSQVFRDMLAGGEAWLFRTTSALNAALATGGQMTLDPRGLPREPGSVLFASGDEDTMQSRVAYVPSEPLYNRLYDERGRSRIMPVEWPPETLEAFGPDFVRWMRECQERQPGDPAPARPKSVGVGVALPEPVRPKSDVRAADAVFAALASSSTALDMNGLAAHPAVAAVTQSTRTIRDALKQLRERDGLVCSVGGGPSTRHELSPAGRERIERQRAMDAEAALVRAGESE